MLIFTYITCCKLHVIYTKDKKAHKHTHTQFPTFILNTLYVNSSLVKNELQIIALNQSLLFEFSESLPGAAVDGIVKRDIPLSYS